jgi:hypothetical protein
VLTSPEVQIGSACQARRSISSPTIPHRVLNFGVFVPDALLACRLVSNGANALVGAAGMLCRRPSPVFPVAPHVLRPISSARSGKCLRGSLCGRALGPSVRVLLRSAGIGGLPASASCIKPCRRPSALSHSTGGEAFQALDGCGKFVPFGFEVLDNPVEVHLMRPSTTWQRTRAATVNLGGFESPAGSIVRRSPAAICRSS